MDYQCTSLDRKTVQQNSSALPYTLCNTSLPKHKEKAYTYYLWPSTPFNLCKPILLPLLYKSSFRTCLSSCTIIIIFRCAFWGSGFLFHDREHQSFCPLCIHMAFLYSSCFFLFLDRESHLWEQPGSSGNWFVSTLRFQVCSNSLECIAQSPLGTVFYPRLLDMQSLFRILQGNFREFARQFLSIDHLARQIIRGISGQR